jgi:hypothetical protein
MGRDLHDRDAHALFRLEHQAALVVDPTNMQAGVFYWADHAERRLEGPLLFSLVTRERLPQPTSRGGLVIRVAPEPQRLIESFRTHSTLWLSAALGAAVALIVATVLPYTERSAQPASHPHPATPAATPPVPATPPPQPAAPLILRTRMVDSGRTRSVVLSAPNNRFSISYRLRGCASFLTRSCRVTVDREREHRFFQSVFAWPNGTADPTRVGALQRALGMSGRDLDGIWGHFSRLRLLTAAAGANRSPLIVPGSTSQPWRVTFEQQPSPASDPAENNQR